MEPHGESGACDHGKPVGADEGLSAAIAFGLAAAWFFARIAPGIVFGPWQGGLVAGHHLGEPLITSWLAKLVLDMPIGPPLLRINAFSTFLGAVAVGATAFLGTTLASAAHIKRPGLVGLLGALVFAVSPPLTYAATGAGPTTTTAACTLIALAALAYGLRGSQGTWTFALAGLFGGFAAANNPAFGVLILLFLLALPLQGLPLPRLGQAALALILSFALSASLPLVAARTAGESFQQFLSHALLTPYPTLFDAAPALFPASGSYLFPLAALALLLASVLLARTSITRPLTLFLALVYLALGPLHPALTNHFGEAWTLRDPRALVVVSTAILSVLLCWTAAVAAKKTRRRAAPISAGLIAALLAVTFGVARIPTRNASPSAEVAITILDALPQRAVLVSGSPNVSSLLTSAQATGLRPDVEIVPLATLVREDLRSAWQVHLDGKVALPIPLASTEKAKRLREEQPALLDAFANSTAIAFSTEQVDLALWEFIRANFNQHPLCFIAVDTPWLAPRLQPCGFFSEYPRNTAAPDIDLAVWQTFAERVQSDPDGQATLLDLLLSLANAYGNQVDTRSAVTLSELACRVAPNSADAALTRVRAAARAGSKEDALIYARAYLRLNSQNAQRAQLEALVPDALDRYALEQATDALSVDAEAPVSPDQGKTLLNTLWSKNEFSLAVRAYESLLSATPGNQDLLYGYSAALAETGDLKRAGAVLKQWMSATTLSPQEVIARLHGDTRFSLLRNANALGNPDPSRSQPDGFRLGPSAYAPPSRDAEGNTVPAPYATLNAASDTALDATRKTMEQPTTGQPRKPTS